MIFLSCLVSLVAAVIVAPVDPCSLVHANATIELSVALACFRSVPFNATRRDAIVDMLTKSLELYVFLDISSNPPAPFEPVDILGELQRIQQTTYAADFDMHMDLAASFAQLNDAHTTYRPPSCYWGGAVFWPLPLFGGADAVTGEPVLSVVDPIAIVGAINDIDAVAVAAVNAEMARRVKFWSSKFLADAALLAIDGADPWEAVLTFANSSVGLTKNAETRATISLTQFLPVTTALGYFTKRKLSRVVTVPPVAGHNVTILPVGGKKPITFAAPFFLVSNADLTSASDFYDRCYPSNTTSQTEDEQRDIEELFGDVRPGATPPTPPLGFTQIFASNTTSIVFWHGITDAGESTLVLWLPTFSYSGAQTLQFAADVSTGFALGQQRGATHLVVDVFLDGGGNICVGLALLNATGLFPSLLASDLPGSDLADALAQFYSANLGLVGGTLWSPTVWIDANTGAPFADASWLVPGTNQTRGGKTRHYSEPVALRGCSATHFPPLTTFNASAITFVSHGFCGSTCAMTVLLAARYSHVRTVVVGVHEPDKQAIVSFPGGQVLEGDDILSAITEASLVGPFVPTPAEESGAWRLAIREIYGPQDRTTPLEYRLFLADDWILPNVTDAKQFGSYWTKL